MLTRCLATLFFIFFNFSLSAQISGSFLVNPAGGGDYNSLTAAAEDLNTQGMSGNVTLELAAALYEEQVLFQIPNQTPSQMLTIQSASGNAEDVVFRFEISDEEMDYQLAFEGIQALTIQNISINTSDLEFGTGIKLIGACSNITVDNLIHNGNRNDAGITGYSSVDIFTPAIAVHNVTITNSYFHESAPSIGFGIDVYVLPEDGISSNFNISGNTFFDANGVTVKLSEDVSITDNIFYGEEYNIIGIEVNSCEGNIRIENNRIWKSGTNGISVGLCVGTESNPILVANNFISGKQILVAASQNEHLIFAHNAVYSDHDNSSGSLMTTFNNTDSQIENNIFYQNNPEGTIFSIFTEDLVTSFDYNCLYSNGSYAVSFDDTGILYLDYEEYKTATGREDNGISALPIFTIPGEDLHTSNEALNVGNPIPEIPLDIDGETRSITNPSIGADEIDGILIVNDLTIDTVITSGDLDAGAELTVSWNGANLSGILFQAPWTDRIFLSDDDQLDDDDTAIADFETVDNLAAGADYTHQKVVQLPLNVFGTKYVIVRINADAQLIEENNNNTAVSVPINITPPPLPNLVVTDITHPGNVFSGTQLQIDFTIENQGDAPASGSWTDIIWQEDFLIGFSDTREHHHTTTNPWVTDNNPIGLMPGESYIGTVTIETPYVYNGYIYISIETDGYDNIVEELDANDNFTNALIDSVFINQSPLADLIVEDIQVPNESFAGAEINISYTVKNNGTETTSPVQLPYNYYFGYTWAPLLADWVDYTYYSDSTFSFAPSQYNLVGTHSGDLEVDSSYVVTQTIQIPECEHGPYFVSIYADRWNHVAELDEENNFTVSDTIHIIPVPGPDLIPTSNDPMEGLASNMPHTLSYHIENQGADTALANWKDRIFISDSAIFQFDIDEMIADTLRTENLLSDAGVDYQINFNIPPDQYGTKYIYLWIDGANEVCEQPFDNNNILQFEVDITQSPAADLHISYVAPLLTYVAGDPINISAITANIGSVAPNQADWTDRIFLKDEVSTSDSIYIETYAHTGGLSPNGAYAWPNPFIIPLDIPPGFYSIGVVTDYGDNVWENESDENNSIQSEPFQISIDSTRSPDLLPFDLAQQAWSPGENYNIEVSITNLAAPAEMATWIDLLMLTDTLGNELAEATSVSSGSIGTNGVYIAQFEMTIPVGAPTDAILIAQIDTSNAIFEYQKTNNTQAFPIQVNAGPTPDLSPTSLNIPSEVYAGQELMLDVMRNNFGEVVVENENWIERVLLSQDNLPDDDDFVLKSYTYISAQMEAETTTVLSDSIQVPLTTAGSYFVIYFMDADNQVAEGFEEGNNYVVSDAPINIPTPAPVDFSSTFLDTTITNGNPQKLQYQLTNTGINTFTGKIYNTWYLSEDAEYNPTDLALGVDQIADFDAPGSQITLTPNESIDRYVSFIYQPVIAGEYYIIQKIDALLNVYESDEQNNTVVFGPFEIDNIPEIFPEITYEKRFGRNFPPLNYFTLGSILIPPFYEPEYDPSPDRHDFKINIPDAYGMVTHMWENEEANADFGIGNDQPIYEMYIGENFVPDPLNFDFKFDSPLQADQTILVPVAEERTDYIKTRAPYIPPHYDPEVRPESQYFLRAELKQFSVFSLSPEKVGNAHNVTLRIKGFDLSDPDGLDVALFMGTDTVWAFETYPQNSSELIAYIDMREYAAGNYHLMVRKRTTGITTFWEEEVEVFEDTGAQIFTEVHAPASSRIGLDIPISVIYGNDGYANIYDMLVVVAIFMDDSTSTGLQVEYLGSSYPGYDGFDFISTESNPAEPILLSIYDNAVYYGAYIPIVHARSQETFNFKVRGNASGVITTQASLGLVQRSAYTFSGRVEDAGRSNFAVLLGNAIASSEDALSDLAKANNCNQVLNADQMTMRLAEQTYEVAKKAHGSTSWWQGVKDNVTGLFGPSNGAKKRYDSFKGLVDNKGDLDLTANKDTPFYSELTDVFNCIDGEVTEENTDNPCIKIKTWTEGNRTFKVKTNMNGYLLSCPDPSDPEKKPKPKDKKETDNTQSKDPNEIIGPRGVGPARLVEGTETFEYTIFFENIAESTAPAARVRIENPLDTNLRFQSLRVVSFGFADTSFMFNNSPFVQQTVGLGSAFENQQLSILAGTNPQTGNAFFEFTTLNPETQGIVTGANDGFLWPNDSTGRGQGFVTYIIDPVADLDPGTEIKNKAAIIFDNNEIIETNTWSNTISGGDLASKVLELPENSATTFELAWVNETPQFGPPAESFDIYVRDLDGRGDWKKWLGGTKSLNKQFTGIPGHTYEFYSRVQSSNLFEEVDGTPDARTTIINFMGNVPGGEPVLFPNPASDQTQLAFRSSGKGIEMKINISNVQGQRISSQKFTTAGAGIQFVTIPLRNIHSGVYVVTLYEGNSKRGSEKLVVTGYPKQ